MRLDDALGAWLAALALTCAAACSATAGTEEDDGAGGSGGGGGSGGSISLQDAGGDGDLPGCSAASQLVYVLDSGRVLYSFDPPSLTFTRIGVVNCPGVANPYSMAVDRVGNAWVVFRNGSLFRVNTATAACTPTGYQLQNGFTTFGMGFSTDGPGSVTDTLFVSDSAGGGLASIDTGSLRMTRHGSYDTISGRAELTGTGDGRLFGAFEGSPYVVAEIDKSSARILSQAPQTAVRYQPGSSNFAFAFWGGDFWLFVGPGSSTDVFHYQPSTGVTLKVKTVPQAIVGAGVSTCAPLVPPQ